MQKFDFPEAILLIYRFKIMHPGWNIYIYSDKVVNVTRAYLSLVGDHDKKRNICLTGIIKLTNIQLNGNVQELSIYTSWESISR